MSTGSVLAVAPLRFEFEALSPIHFPEGKASNILRGALGSILRKIICLPECGGPECCPQADCFYTRAFSPKLKDGPSGLADPPRPFLLRATQFDGQTLSPGARFCFDLHLFLRDKEAIPYFVLALRQTMVDGLGPGRATVRLLHVDALNRERQVVQRLYENDQLLSSEPNWFEVVNEADDLPATLDKVQVQFLTPTELKHAGQLVKEPRFSVLWARLRDRLAALRLLYGDGGRWEDMSSLNALAEEIQIVTQQLHWIDLERKSSRTRQTHPLGGFVGTVEYQGELTSFHSWLRSASWVGVGRQCLWGKGWLEI
jgi:CRISPR-associated endoribonuclease Cas6